MKRLRSPILLILLTLCSCKKFIEKKEQQAALSIMTNGHWYVSGYKQNDSDITASFSGFLFKFDDNYTVTGTKGSFSSAGQWSVDINARTITANFPASGGDTLKLLNEVWKIHDSYDDSVSAITTDPTTNATDILQLKKQ